MNRRNNVHRTARRNAWVRRALRLALVCAGLSALGAGTMTAAQAQSAPEQQDLYLEAIKSIAEGRKSDASDALTRMIAKEPQHAGAWLDLALIQCELGHAVEAERLFQAIETRFAPPPGILEVINKQRAIGCAGWQRQRHWSLTLGRGHDQNVNQGASNPNFTIGQGTSQVELQLSPEFLPLADNYTVLATDYSLELNPNGIIGFTQFQARHNDQLSRYNTDALSAGIELPWRIKKWALHTAANFSFLTLDGRLYQRQSQLQARLTPPLPLPERWQFNLSATLSHVQYLSLTNFNGHTIDLRAQLAYRTGDTQASGTFGFSNDRAVSQRPGGDRQGWFTGLQIRSLLKNDIAGELGWTRQTWRGESAYSPGVIPETRDQNTQILRATLIIPVANRQTVQVELRQVRNQENISIFQYNNRQLQVSWQWQGL